jgi:AbiV family abortive infection protein
MTISGKESKGKFRIIPSNMLDEGLELCARNIGQLAEDTYILLDRATPRVWSALALAIFAFEELAKYAELKKAKELGKATVEIDNRLFAQHSYKQKIALSLVPKDAVELLSSRYGEASYGLDYYGGVSVTPKLRLQCVFVDWEDGKWVSRPSTMIVDNVVKFMVEIEKALSKLSGRKPPPFNFTHFPSLTAIRYLSFDEFHKV